MTAHSKATVPADIRHLPAAERSGHIGVVHLGLGAFHRAHQAVYLERFRQHSGDPQWGICSANLRSNHALVDQLRATDGRYHVAEYTDSSRVLVREVGTIEEVLFTGQDDSGIWGRDLDQLLHRLAHPDTRIVTLTVTEKGYFLNPADGALLTEHALIRHDMTHPEQPRTAPGLLVAALAARRAAGVAPFAVLSCDNMPANGERAQGAVVRLAAQTDPELAQWIEQQVAFPSSMVDRIVPAMTAADFERLSSLRLDDPSAVIGEAFAQWVIEDRFPAGRPQWESVGVEMVPDVAPFETMKLRMLNGSHSLLAYLGALHGVETVYDAVCQPGFRALLRHYMGAEAAPTLDVPAGVDLTHYCEDLLQRFANDSLQHRLHQIAMDGSQKLPQRWLYGALEQLAAGRSIRATALGVAAWMRYTRGTDLQGQPFAISDPMAETLQDLHRTHQDGPSLVRAFLALEAVVPPALARQEVFRAAVQQAFQDLETQSLDELLAAFL
ncbi:mannitol dehydrogenase family protein [Natronospirillum operosum]|uniref:Mannitol dehydrogenase family protein n=1 Tax=Natronospirillum operosum TaxID=2759953 RepID=A0A4Z0W7Z8_9GAMM|nr:mannitol dehydrogenase family protein [Natronospirillum operosum]TGG93527.1 mannitol dehydrogenase family protein [Natronospirillum operosum]